MSDYLFRGSIADLDPNLDELLELEAERQYRKLIMIPSESTAPLAIRQTLAMTGGNREQTAQQRQSPRCDARRGHKGVEVEARRRRERRHRLEGEGGGQGVEQRCHLGVERAPRRVLVEGGLSDGRIPIGRRGLVAGVGSRGSRR